MLKIILFLITLGLSLFVLAQNLFRFEMQGQFQEASSYQGRSFTLHWSEYEGQLKGEYSDNKIKNARVVGTQSKDGRHFQVLFPHAENGAESLSIITGTANPLLKTSELIGTFILRDKEGNPISSTENKIKLRASHLSVQRQEERECQSGFGALGGYCGFYAGLITEKVDRQDKCDLLRFGTVSLELTPERDVNLFLGESLGRVDSSLHELGKIPLNTNSTRIDITNRVCKPLLGVNLEEDSCKKLVLTGEFSIIGANQHFKGSYTIFDEGTQNTCSFGLTFDGQ